MIEHSSKSKGYLPVKSGPNRTGFYMGNSNSLMEMMQTGGQPSRGAAMLAQATQRQSDIKKLEAQQRAEAKRQGRGALFGSIASKGLGLLGSAIAGPLGAGIGSALGKRLGEGIGAGKSREYDSSGTVFGQQDFRDVEQASRDYTRGMGERAIVSGLEAGLTAKFAPGGGMYGKVSGKLSDVGSSILNSAARQGMDTALQMAQRPAPLYGEAGPITVLGGAFPGYNPGGTFEDGGLIAYQYGGGVGDIQNILQDAGITATPQQLALFEQFDPTALNRMAEGLQDSLLSGTQQAQQAQAGTGFAGSGAVQQAQVEQRERAGEQMAQATEDASKAFASQTLGEAASMIGQGAEFGTVRNQSQGTQYMQAPTGDSNWNPPANPMDSARYSFEGTDFVYSNGRWIDAKEYEDNMSTYYDDMYD